MKILLTGASGQLGLSLQQHIPDNIELLALDRHALDITSYSKVMEAVGAFHPDWIINAAAYTTVDEAEVEQTTAEAINHHGAGNLAKAAEQLQARMVHISTDYVFDGVKAGPYMPDDATNPINVYGRTKLAGEQAVRNILGEQALILRTAWVYASHGHNFLNTMLRLMNERDTLNVVEDQVGTPTSTSSLADVILRSIECELSGTHHWTDAGVASWYDFACEISCLADKAGLLNNSCHIQPIPTSAYPTPATRPQNSMLDKQSTRVALQYPGRHWSESLLDEINKLSR